MDHRIIRGESEIYGHNDSMVWAYILTALLILGEVAGFIYAIFIV